MDRDPANHLVQAELSRLLAVQDREQATREMLGAIRGLLKRGQVPSAARCALEAGALGLPLPLAARERLRLAGALETMGEAEAALALLKALIQETPEAPEDEMARLKLGQLLRERDPAPGKHCPGRVF